MHIQNFNYVQFFSLFNDKNHCRKFQNYCQVQTGKTYQLFQNPGYYHYITIHLSLSLKRATLYVQICIITF